MKKFFLPFVLLLTLAACKKESKVTDNDIYPEDSATVYPETNENTETVALKEFSSQQIADLVSAKENDTTYVTNFFATWCGPCMREIPHFKEKMTELQGKPVKFTFISVDQKSDWNTAVKKFGEENGLSKNIVLLDATTITPEFFKANFKTWDGGSIPFTVISHGKTVQETVGMMSKEELDSKLSHLASNTEKTETPVK